MPAPFHALRDQAIAAVDAVMAETVQLLFLDRNGRSDTSRPNFAVKGVLRAGGGDARSPTAGMSWQSRIVAGKAELHIDRVAYGNRPMVRERDKVRADERAGRPLWEVSGVDDRHHGRIVLELQEA